ncbi:type II toxin-antitoxin system ParD family antitoxin [Asticcacaulis solisilvae]|uniref:type II toxin-antitoxin system ParD family antitoxin n=1 Tax=Asticcacaulis solisilvae TaxID=1217274 RepID=UPI003FD83837
MRPLNLGIHYESFIRDQLAAGHFDTVSQLMCEALRLLEERQTGAPTLAVPEMRYDDVETRSVFDRVRSQLRLQP